MRPLRILRRATLTLLALTLALWIFVQFQQRLLRHRAEKLHAEIVALQLHPGTFADIERLQKEWGRHAHYEGECTPHHCIDEINLSDWISSGGTRAIDSEPFFRSYALLGGRPVRIGANIRVHDNRMWGEDFFISASVLPDQDTRLYSGVTLHEGFGLFAALHGGPHLFNVDERWFGQAMKLGYRDGFEGACSGCVGAEIYVTSETNPQDVAWLTHVDFGCITRWKPCLSENELLPQAWPRHHSYEFRRPGDPDSPFDETDLSSAPIESISREASNAVLAEVIATIPDNGKDPYGTSIRVIRRLKNAETEPPGSVFGVDLDATTENVAKAFGVASVAPPQRYIFVYEEPHGELDRGHDLRAVLPANEQTLQAFLDSAASDPSVGEPIDWWRNERPR